MWIGAEPCGGDGEILVMVKKLSAEQRRQAVGCNLKIAPHSPSSIGIESWVHMAARSECCPFWSGLRGRPYIWGASSKLWSAEEHARQIIYPSNVYWMLMPILGKAMGIEGARSTFIGTGLTCFAFLDIIFVDWACNIAIHWNILFYFIFPLILSPHEFGCDPFGVDVLVYNICFPGCVFQNSPQKFVKPEVIIYPRPVKLFVRCFFKIHKAKLQLLVGELLVSVNCLAAKQNAPPVMSPDQMPRLKVHHRIEIKWCPQHETPGPHIWGFSR